MPEVKLVEMHKNVNASGTQSVFRKNMQANNFFAKGKKNFKNTNSAIQKINEAKWLPSKHDSIKSQNATSYPPQTVSSQSQQPNNNSCHQRLPPFAYAMKNNCSASIRNMIPSNINSGINATYDKFSVLEIMLL